MSYKSELPVVLNAYSNMNGVPHVADASISFFRTFRNVSYSRTVSIYKVHSVTTLTYVTGSGEGCINEVVSLRAKEPDIMNVYHEIGVRIGSGDTQRNSYLLGIPPDGTTNWYPSRNATTGVRRGTPSEIMGRKEKARPPSALDASTRILFTPVVVIKELM